MADVTLVKDVRELSADDLDIGYAHRAQVSHGSSAPDAPVLHSDDPRLKTILRLLRRFGGVILSGPPGTSKSWLAGQVADRIAEGHDDRRADIQFHASYQFEDFMEGYRPKEDANGFEPRDGVFLSLIRKAKKHPDTDYVIIIDELSRADVGRVFGEALTYIERSKRGQNFTLPSGQQCSIPLNLYLIATMNPLDRGVDEVDAAFERRFAKVDMPPSRELLEELLDRNGFLNGTIQRRLLGWFSKINSRSVQTPAAAIGHAYFADVVDPETLQEVWDYQLKHHVDRAFKYDPDTRTEIMNGWADIFAASADQEVPIPDDTESV
jgi:5-methylcytosine-specific restriction protein B